MLVEGEGQIYPIHSPNQPTGSVQLLLVRTFFSRSPALPVCFFVYPFCKYASTKLVVRLTLGIKTERYPYVHT